MGEQNGGREVPVERISMTLIRSIGVAMAAVMGLLWLQGQGDKIVEKMETSQEKSDAKNEANFKTLESKLTTVTNQVTTLAAQVDRVEDKVGQGFVQEREFDGWVFRANAILEAARITSERPITLPKLRE